MAKLLITILLALMLMLLIATTVAQEREIEEHKHSLVENVNKHIEVTLTKEKRTPKKRSNKKKEKNGKRRKVNSVKKNMGRKRQSKSDRNQDKKQQNSKKKKSLMRAKKKSKRPQQKFKKSLSTRRKGKSSCRQQTTFCPVDQATSLKLLYNQVTNFKKQLKRVESQAKIVQKKKAKNTIFRKDALILTDVVGGNLSAPVCTATDAPAGLASEASSDGTILAGCSASISTSCEDISINKTLTGACSSTIDAFVTKVNSTECRSSGTEEGCTCWAEAIAMKSNITKCNAVKESNKVKKKKATCLKAFSICKKAQDSAVEYTATCPAPVISPSRTSTTSSVSKTTTESMTFETPIIMTQGTQTASTKGPSTESMIFETPIIMKTGTQTASTKGRSRKEMFAQNYMAKAIRKYLK